MSRSTFSGPVLSGTVRYNTYKNVGNSVITQTATITQNSTNVVSATFYIPGTSQLIDILVDPIVAFDSVTSAVLSVGTAAAGTQYASGVDVKGSTTRVRPTFTLTQLTNMAATAVDSTATAAATPGGNHPISTVVATVTPTGATTAGQVRVTLIYAQYDDRSASSAV